MSTALNLVKKTLPTPSEAFATYWQFAARRQQRYFAKWDPQQQVDADPILDQYRFTNVYRAADRVSQYLIKEVQYNQQWDAENLFFRTMLFKLFNSIPTWRALVDEFGEPEQASFDAAAYATLLTDRREEGATVYNAAYIMPDVAQFQQSEKHRNHLALLNWMMDEQLPQRVAAAGSFAEVYQLLKDCPGIGAFLAYQLAVDLNYSPLIEFSENDFVQPGPGALDGLSKCFTSLGDYTPAAAIEWLTDTQQEHFERYAPNFQTLWGRWPHLIDLQNVFCEVSKYTRVSHPHIAGKAGRTSIKQHYKPATTPPKPFFPVNWKITTGAADNERALQ